MNPNNKTIRVVAAIIRKEDKVFSAQRGYGDLKGKWEFPGGKIEAKETPEEAIIREIKEELGTDIAVDSFFMNVKHEYPTFNLDMDVFLCHVLRGRLEVEEGIHLAEAYFTKEEMLKQDYCPADRKIVAEILSRL